MNKYFKYILVFMIIFLCCNLKVEAGIFSGGMRTLCKIKDVNGKEIYLATENNGERWYAGSYLQYSIDPFSIEGKLSNYEYIEFLDTSNNENPLDCTYLEENVKLNINENVEVNPLLYGNGSMIPDYFADVDGVEEDRSTLAKDAYEHKEKQEIVKEIARRDRYESGSNTNVSPITPSETSCSDLFSGVRDVIKPIFNAIKIIIPILVIVLSALDFAKAIFGSDDSEVKKAQGKFIKRLVVAFIFFLLPTFLSFFMEIMNGAYNGNWNCIILD